MWRPPRRSGHGDSAQLKSLDQALHGTQVLLAWAAWLQQRNLGLARRSVVLTKGRQRLVVHEYVMGDGESICGVVSFDDAVPRAIVKCGSLVHRGESRLRAFREWQAPLERVALELTNRGWKPASRDVLTTEGGDHARRS